jgi:hypothetical protein
MAPRNSVARGSSNMIAAILRILKDNNNPRPPYICRKPFRKGVGVYKITAIITTMKKTKIAYWIVTGLFAAFMLMSGFFDAISTPEALKVFKDLQLPAYLSPFLGVAKLLGAIAILIPGFPKLKEWAYAGLFFDLLGAAYCGLASGQPASGAVFMILPIAFLFISYWLFHRKSRAAA